MRKRMAVSMLVMFVAAAAFAHAGHLHTYMGTVVERHKNGEFVMKTTDAKTLTVVTTSTTAWRHADGTPAKPAELKAGERVVVVMGKDGKTAASVKVQR